MRAADDIYSGAFGFGVRSFHPFEVSSARPGQSRYEYDRPMRLSSCSRQTQQSRKVVSHSGLVTHGRKIRDASGGRRQRETIVLPFLISMPFCVSVCQRTFTSETTPQMRHPLANHCSQGKSCSNARSSSLARALAPKAPRRTSLLWSSAKALNRVKPNSRISICASIETGS